MVEMTPLRFENVTVCKVDSGNVLGFHNENLEVAQLSESLWTALVEGRDCEAISELKAWSDSVNSKVSRSSSPPNIRVLTINSTQLCNLHCTYCAAGGDGTYGRPLQKLDVKKALPQLEWMIARCLPGERFQINFLGGEPLLYPEVVREVAAMASQLAANAEVALRFGIVTNGTLLDRPEVLDVLIDFRMLVTVSVDGPPEIQDRFRPTKVGKGSSGKLETGLRQLQTIKNKLPGVGLSAVFHRDSVGVLAAYNYFLKWDFDFYEFNFSHDEFDVQSSQEFTRELRLVAALADLRGGELELRKIRAIDSLFQRLDERIRLENYCGAGKSLLSMDAQGDLFACPWDINEKTLKLNSPAGGLSDKIQEFTRPHIQKLNCAQCWAKYVCGGGCQFTHKKSTGSAEKVDPQFCERMQNLILLALMYYEKYRRSFDETH